MFNFFKRDPAREIQKEANKVLKIPVEFIAITAETFANVYNVLVRVNLKDKFDEQTVFSEIGAFHVKTVIVTMNRKAGIVGGIFAPNVEAAYERNENFLMKSVPEILANAKTKGNADTALFETLMSEKTLKLAADYFTGIGLEVSDEDVLDFGKKYNPKLLSLSSSDRANSIHAYIIRVIRITHAENLPVNGDRIATVAALNNTLFKAALDLEVKIGKLAP